MTLGAANRENEMATRNAMEFIARMVAGEIFTAELVQVIAVGTNTVDVQIMTNQIDGLGNASPHGTIRGRPWFTLQSGLSAVLVAPTKGDKGMAVFAGTDISSVKANKAISNPGSRRRYDPADGIYFGAIPALNATPTQTITMSDAAGIAVVSPVLFKVTAPSIVLDGNTATTGTLTNNGADVSSTHTHPYLPGSGALTETGTPV